MPYITKDYYDNTFLGESVDDADFPSLLSRAEEIIETMTTYRLGPSAFNKMSEAVQERVKMAVCAQIEYLDANGGSDVDNGSELQSAGLGKFNYTKATGTDGNGGQSIFSPRAQRILFPTGLLYRGGGL